jgi:hypothetical protein
MIDQERCLLRQNPGCLERRAAQNTIDTSILIRMQDPETCLIWGMPFEAMVSI